MLWWSFRQGQDPGNLVDDPSNAIVLAVSMALTFSGLLLFSFLVGIGTTAIWNSKTPSSDIVPVKACVQRLVAASQVTNWKSRRVDPPSRRPD